MGLEALIFVGEAKTVGEAVKGRMGQMGSKHVQNVTLYRTLNEDLVAK